MLTDWVLIARLARELKERFGGARVEDAGMLPDGRIGLLLRQRGARRLLAFDLYASPPLVTVEDGELGITVEPGFVRALARSLHGMLIDDVVGRRNDRLVRMSFRTRSRFGVGERLELYIELVPRFGNAVLVKDETVVAALKEFAPADNPRRSIQAGKPYELPPLPASVRTLPDYPSESVLETFARLHSQQVLRAGNERVAARRRMLLKRLADRDRKLHGEVALLREKRHAAAGRDALRAEGDAIFATLYELTVPESEAAKERAGKIFARYKKLGKSLPHIEARERELVACAEAIETLRWETERAADEDLEAVELAARGILNVVEGRRGPPKPQSKQRKGKRPPLEFRTASGSRILVGRSPIENADLTFRQARPDDLWFHAQRIPGAHVILARDDLTAAPTEDIAMAAALAAFHSRARNSASVPVDYTVRKHVRKQRAAPPGLVWYTHAKTVVAEPQEKPPGY